MDRPRKGPICLWRCVMIWFLVLYSVATGTMEGGQYQTEAGCRAAAPVIVQALQASRGRALQWGCVEARSFSEAAR